MTNVKQNMGFVGGEITPKLHAGVDLNRYRSSMKTMRNFFVEKNGAASNRPGTTFVRELRSSLGRLVPFVFNSDNTYAIEFSYNAVATRQSFIKNGVSVFEAPKSITSISKASPGVVTKVAHGYLTGEEILINATHTDGSTPTGMVEIDGRYFIVQKINADTFSLRDIESVSDLDTTSFTTFTSGTMARVYKITPPYVSTGEFLEMQWVQQADVMTFTHPNYLLEQLTRSSDTSWAWAAVPLNKEDETYFYGLGFNSEFPRSVASTAPTAGVGTDNQDYRYAVTSVDPLTGAESCAGNIGSTISIQTSGGTPGISNANPAAVHATAHGLSTGDDITIFAVLGMWEVNYRRFKITVTGVDTFTLDGVNSTGYSTYVSATGSVVRQYSRSYSQKLPTAAAPIVVTFRANSSYINSSGTPIQYKIYRADAPAGLNHHNNVFGYIGTVVSVAPQTTITFNDTGFTPDITHQPPINLYQWVHGYGESTAPIYTAPEFSAACGVYKGRLLLGGSAAYPERMGGSKIAAPHVWTREFPIPADGSFIYDINGKQVSRVKFFSDLGRLVVFTANDEVQFKGDGNGNLTPSLLNPERQSSHGIGDLFPLNVDGSALFVDRSGSTIRDLDWVFQLDGYRGNDVTIYGSHLVQGHTIVDWAWQKNPNSIVWAVRDDGVLLSLTYVREQQIIAWAKHDTYGTVERVCVIPEDTEDVVYLVVTRNALVSGTAGYRDKRLLERMSSRILSDDLTDNFLDSSVLYDGRNTSDTTVVMSGSTWTAGSSVDLGSSVAIFTSPAAGDTGRHIRITGSDGTIINGTITFVSTSSAVVITVDADVPLSMRNVNITQWAWLSNYIYAWHLDGLDVSSIVDGYVFSNPNQVWAGYGPEDIHPDYLTVTNGKVSFPDYFSVIRVGLSYTCDLETLDIDTIQGQTLMNRKVLVSNVGVYFNETRDVWVGHSLPEADYSTENMAKVPRGEEEVSTDAPSRRTGAIVVPTRSKWVQGGHTAIRVIDPTPCTVLAITPSGLMWSKE